jgi:hypothetical protein
VVYFAMYTFKGCILFYFFKYTKICVFFYNTPIKEDSLESAFFFLSFFLRVHIKYMFKEKEKREERRRKNIFIFI